jgi:hypothetical protein
MADMRSMRFEIVFMMREFLSLELVIVLTDLCASLEMLLSTVRASGSRIENRM